MTANISPEKNEDTKKKKKEWNTFNGLKQNTINPKLYI